MVDIDMSYEYRGVLVSPSAMIVNTVMEMPINNSEAFNAVNDLVMALHKNGYQVSSIYDDDKATVSIKANTRDVTNFMSKLESFQKYWSENKENIKYTSKS